MKLWSKKINGRRFKIEYNPMFQNRRRMSKNNQYTPGQLSLQWTIFIFFPVYYVHFCCDKQVIKWLLKPIHVVSGLFYYSSV